MHFVNVFNCENFFITAYPECKILFLEKRKSHTVLNQENIEDAPALQLHFKQKLLHEGGCEHRNILLKLNETILQVLDGFFYPFLQLNQNFFVIMHVHSPALWYSIPK